MDGGTGQKTLPLMRKICDTYPTIVKLGTVLPYLRKIQKIYHVTHPLNSADITNFYWDSENFAMPRNTDIDSILTHNL